MTNCFWQLSSHEYSITMTGKLDEDIPNSDSSLVWLRSISVEVSSAPAAAEGLLPRLDFLSSSLSVDVLPADPEFTTAKLRVNSCQQHINIFTGVSESEKNLCALISTLYAISCTSVWMILMIHSKVKMHTFQRHKSKATVFRQPYPKAQMCSVIFSKRTQKRAVTKQSGRSSLRYGWVRKFQQ